MANAMKCDKCGKLFDPMNIGKAFIARIRNPIFQNEQDKRKGTVGFFLINDEYAQDVYIDFCPECTVDFIKFLNKEAMLS